MKKLVLIVALALFTVSAFAQEKQSFWGLKSSVEAGYGFGLEAEDDDEVFTSDKKFLYGAIVKPLGDFEVGIGGGINSFKEEFVNDTFNTYPLFARFGYNIPIVKGLHINLDVGHMFYSESLEYYSVLIEATGKLHLTGNLGYDYTFRNGISVGAFVGYNLQKMVVTVTYLNEDYSYKPTTSAKEVVVGPMDYDLKLPSIDTGLRITF